MRTSGLLGFLLLISSTLSLMVGCNHKTHALPTTYTISITNCAVAASQKNLYVNEDDVINWVGVDTQYTINFGLRRPTQAGSFNTPYTSTIKPDWTCALSFCGYGYTMAPTASPKNVCKDPSVHVSPN